MYKPNLIPILALATAIVMQGCSKDNKPEPNVPPELKTQLASIEWNSGFKETYEYNSDKTLKKIVYKVGQVENTVEHTWDGNLVKEVYETSENFKNVYHYSNGRVTYSTRETRTSPSTMNFKLEYDYRPDGKVSKMRYIAFAAGVPELKSATDYNYNNAGELISSVTTTGNTTVTQVIDGYSSPVQFIPWAYIEQTLLENYMIFNYPVLSSMKGFPSRITRKVKQGSDAEFVDILTTFTCEIQNNAIKKMVTELTSPTTPEINKTRTALYSYK